MPLRGGNIHEFFEACGNLSMRWRHVLQQRASAHRLDESPVGYSLAGCSPTEPASASPISFSMLHKRPAGRLFHSVAEIKNWSRNASKPPVTFPDEATRAVKTIGGGLRPGLFREELRRMVQFAEAFPEKKIVVTLSRQLSWPHFSALLPLSQPFQREFYAEMCRIEGWSVRTLRERIDSMLYERTALSRQPDALIRQELAILRRKGDVTSALVLKDTYVLDSLGLTDRFREHDLEDAILRELDIFLLELGAGFSFVARQKRIQLDGDDFYIDLLFYNHKLKRSVVVELQV